MNEMIENVLLLCPGCDREAVKNDLNITGNLQTTLNHALDGMLVPRTSKLVSTSSPPIDCPTIRVTDDNDIMLPSSKFTHIKEKSASSISKNIFNNSSTICGNTNSLTSNISKRNQSLIIDGEIDHGKCDFMELSDSDDDNLVYSKKTDIIIDNTDTKVTRHCRQSCSDSDDSLPVVLEKDQATYTSKISNITDKYIIQDDNIIQSKEDVLMIDNKKQERSIENVEKRKKRSKEEIEEQKRLAALKKLSREKERSEKLEERKRQKEAKAAAVKERKMAVEKDKLNKKAEKLTKSTLTLANCLKFVTVCLDNRLLVSSSNEIIENNPIIQKLAAIEANYKIEEQFYPCVITWQRIRVQHCVGNEQLTITTSNTYTEEKEVLMVLEAKQFAEMIHSFKLNYHKDSSVTCKEKTLVDFVKDLNILYPNKNITFLVSGLEKYMRTLKTKQHRVFRDVATASSDENDCNKKRRKRKLDSTVNITRTDIEEALIDLQIKTNVCVYPCETNEDIAVKVASFTKAVAEKPYKKSVMEGFEFCLDRMDKTSLKVSKDGQGMIRVWQQQIEQFRNVSKDMASAIIMQYPSPQLLMKAYKECCSEREALLLLEDIVVRRGGGSLATSRRIGPELSKRFYKLFHSKDNTELMKK